MPLSLKRLNDPVFRAALNGLCWIEPFDNAGVWDVGWCCREHAWFTALLARSLGHDAVPMHGKACFIPRFPKNATVLGILQDAHSWVRVDGLGLIDLSIKPAGKLRIDLTGTHLREATSEFVEYGVPFPLQPVFGAEGLGSRATIVWDQNTFNQRCTSAIHDRSRSSAIYLGLQYSQPSPQMLTDAASWVNSPLTVRLTALLGPGFYLKALHYLRDLVTAKNAPLPGAGIDLWRSIDKRYQHSDDREALRLVRLDSDAA